MYRSRFWIWVAAVATAILMKGIVYFIANYDEIFPSLNICLEIEDMEMNTYMGIANRIDRCHIVPNRENADIIISECSDETIEGYVKYEEFFYSPIVMYAWNAVLSKSGYIASGSVATVDLYTMLTALENDCDYEDIGIDAKGKVTIVIPNQNSPYYDLIEDLFYTTFNKNKIPTDIERQLLKERVDNLLAKCTVVGNVGTYLETKYNKKDKEYIVALAVEALGANNDQTSVFSLRIASGNQHGSAWDAVYINPCMAVCYDLYIKEENKDFIYKTLCSSKIPCATGFRTRNDYGGSWNYSTNYIKPIN